jgi:hypothetical protein
VDGSEREQNGGSRHSARLDSLPLVGHDLHDQFAHPNGVSSGKTATSSTQYDSDTSQYSSRKRKDEQQHGGDSKRPHIEDQLGSRKRECSQLPEHQLGNGQDKRDNS